MAASDHQHQITIADKVVSGWMTIAARRPALSLGILLATMMLALIGATRLSIDADSSKMISANLPFQQRAAALNEAFPQLKANLVLTVRAVQTDAADATARWLARELTETSPWISDVFTVADDPFLASHGFMYRSLPSIEIAFSRLSKSANLIAHLRADQTVEGFASALADAALLTERAEIDPASLDRLFDETSAVLESHLAGGARSFSWSSVLDNDAPIGPVTRIVSITPKLDLTRLSPAKPALLAVQETIDRLPPALSANITIGVTGEPALRAEERQSVLATIGYSLALSMILVALILWIGLRSIGRVLLALAALVVSLVLTTGVAGFLLGDLNLISIAFVVLMVGLGIDFAIHVLAHISELRGQGSSNTDAIVLTGQRTGLALFLGAITTSAAFLSFATTDFDGMSQLGVLGGAGVLIAFAVAITLIPATIVLFPSIAATVPPKSTPQAPKASVKILPIVAIVVGLASVWPASNVRFDPDPMGLRDPASSSVKAFRALAADPATTPYRASVLAASEHASEMIKERFTNASGIGSVVTVRSLIPNEQDTKLALLDIVAPSIDHAIAGNPTALITRPASALSMVDRLSESLRNAEGAGGRLHRALEAYRAGRTDASDHSVTLALFRYFPIMIERLGAMLEADIVTIETLPNALRQRFVSANGLYRVEILPEADLSSVSAIHTFADRVLAIEPKATGGPVQLSMAGKVVSSAILQATLLAALVTALLALSATRRLTDTLAILMPLVLAGIVTAGASTLLDMPFNYANVIVLPLLIGIGVDSGIHIAIRERRAPGAVFATSTPRAVLVSAMTTVAAFGTLAFSDHRGTASMGTLLAVAMVAAIVSVFTLTPWIMRWLAQR